jgi:uncharacterized protein (TIGR02001 family)
MLNKKLLSVAVATALTAGISAVPANAGEGVEITGNVALATDYRFRGISQTDEEAAIQGGFDMAFEPGFYLGTWGSSVDFGGADYGTLELDYYGGWAGNIGDSDFGIDVGYIYYDYPGDSGDIEGDYQEVYVGVSWMDATVQVNYSDDYYAETDEFWYLSGGYGFELVEGITIDLHVGLNMLEEDGGFLGNGEDEYMDYSVSATYSYSGVDFTLAGVGTDLSDGDLINDDWGDDSIVFSISKSL